MHFLHNRVIIITDENSFRRKFVTKITKNRERTEKDMKEKYCEMLFAFDCGSTAAEQSEQAVKAFKGFITAQKKLDGEANITGISFNEEMSVIMDNKPIKKVTAKDYGFFHGNGRGECRMLDALSKLINDTGKRLSETPEEERPSKVIVCITTFGRDNASKKCTYDVIKEMIALQRDVYKWKFILATDFTINMEKLGIAPEDTIVFRREEKDMFKPVYEEINEMITAERAKL